MKKLFRLNILLVFGWLAMPITGFAQGQTIFGTADPATSGFGDPVPDPASSENSSSESLSDEHVVVQSLRRSPPRSEIEVARAILYMTRIERWDEVGRYLDQLAKLSLDQAKALKMERAAGLETWFKIAGHAGKLSDEQRAIAKKIIDLSSDAARIPAALSAAIQLLRSKELLDRKRGVLAIQAAGDAGLATLLESVAGSDIPPTPIMSETIITLGTEGEAALKAALTTPDQKARERLMLVAARIPGPTYMAELAAALYSLPPDSDTHRQISKVLSPAGQALPQAAVSLRYVLTQMESQLSEFTMLRREMTSETNSVWRWSPDGKHLLTELDDAAGVHLEQAYRLAYLAQQLEPHAGVDSALATAVILERNYRLSPSIEWEADDLPKARGATEPAVSLDFLGRVLEAAKKAELCAAELRSTQAIGLALKKYPTDSSLGIRRLSETVKNSAPPMRYTAAIALRERPDPMGGFEGKYGYEQTLLEMQRLEGKPLALVVGGSVDLRDNLSKHLSQLGIRTLGASSARETLRLIQEPQPIEYVFVVDRVLGMNLSELVQRIRTLPRTSWLPLAIMTDQIGATQRAILQDTSIQPIHYSSVTANIDLTAALVSEMQRRSPVPKLDSIDRLLFRSRVEPVSK